MTPQPSVIAHYRITAKLGEGGMGAVYRATDTKLNREVAIKVLPPAFAEDAARMQRFEREAQVLASLNHPNIAAIYGVEQSAIVMELVEGEELRGAMPVETALDYARQIAAGLEAAHEKGIVHRDLKPANIKVTPDGTVKLLDFGLAKATEQSAVASATSPTLSPTISLAMTQAGMILGTAAYMSPEQARGKVTDKRADIWAFGVVLYEMITGRRPFEGEDVSHTMAAVIMQEPKFDGIPVRLHRLLKSCLEKDPKKRLRDIGDIWRMMAEDAPAPPAAAAPPTRSRAALAASLIAALAIVAAGALAFVHFREQPPAIPLTRFTIAFPNEVLQQAAISPDGRQIVAATNVVGQGTHLVLRSLDTLESHVVPGTDSATLPFWSPDSRYIGFVAGSRLKIIDARGGPPQSLADVTGFRGGAWSSSDTILFASSGAPLKQIRSGGGTPSDVLATPMRASAPVFLPGGRHFLFTGLTDNLDQEGIYLGSLDGSDPENRQPRRVLPDISRAVIVPATDNHTPVPDRLLLLFVRDNTLMGVGFDGKERRTTGDVYPVAERVARAGTPGNERFGASSTGTLIYEAQNTADRKLAWYDRQGKELGTVDEPGAYRSVSLSPDGTQLAVDREIGGNTDIWIHDLTRNSKIRLTSDPSAETNPLWSSDGKWIAYNSGRNDLQSVYRKAASGAGGEELVVQGGSLHLYDWSRDGKYFMVASTPTPTALRDLFAVPLEGEHKLMPLVQTKFRDDHGRFSPDVRFMAYKSNETGHDEVYVQPFPPGATNERWMISGGAGTMPRWSRNGKELYFISQGKLMVAPVQTTPVFHAGLPKLLFAAPIAGNGGGAYVCWDLTPDGKRFLMITQETSPREPLTVVLNWPAGLRK